MRRRILAAGLLALAGAGATAGAGAAQPAQELFTTPPGLDDMRDKQAVVETTAGTFVIDLLPEAAPNHVGLFLQAVNDGTYDGTAFHAMVARGIVQGGDPLSADPAVSASWRPSRATNGIRRARCRRWGCRAIRTAKGCSS